jgi:ankyrin repeat protein
MSRFQGFSKYLINHGADIHATFFDKNHSRGFTTLHLAAERKLPSMADYLIRNGVKVDARDINQTTPLHVAASYGAYHTAETLIRNGANVNAVNRQGNTPLHEIAGHWRPEKGHLDIASLLIKNNADVNALNQDGRTPYYLALKKSRNDVAVFLKPLTNTKLVSLHDAASDDNLSLIKILLAEGKNINQADTKGNTPLNRALMNKNVELAKYLVSRGAQLNTVNKSGQSPLNMAVRHGDDPLIKQMLANVVDLDPTLLNAAVHAQKLEIVALLLDKGVNVNVQDPKSGWTPLHFAALVNNYEIAALLLKHGASTRIRSHKDRSAMNIAADKNHLQLANLIEAYGYRESVKIAQEAEARAKAKEKAARKQEVKKAKKGSEGSLSYNGGGK